MMILFKIGIAATVIGFTSWLSGKKPELAGFIIALPIASLLALAFSQIEHKDAAASITFAKSILIGVPVSWLFFAPFFFADRLGGNFWLCYAIGLALLVGGFFIHRLVVGFLALIARLKEQYADLVLAHFSSYEVSNIRRYAKRYEMENDPTVVWLLGEDSPLFDLQKPVKESLVLPISSYGLKQICKHEGLVNFQWQDDESGSQWSVVQFVKYQAELLKDRREQMKKDILTYNYDDVMATRQLEIWLSNQ